MSAYLSSLTPVFTRHTYALRESIDVSRSSTKAIGLAAEPQYCCRSPPRFRDRNWPLAVVATNDEISQRNKSSTIFAELSVYLFSFSGLMKFSVTPARDGTIGAIWASGSTSARTGRYSAAARIC